MSVGTMASERRLARVLIACLALISLPLGSAGATQATINAGREIVARGVVPGRPGCASCHMQDGAGQPGVGIPRLAGLTASYIDAQLGYFAGGARYDTVMTPYAKMLTPAQRQEVADYFASLPVPKQPNLLEASAARVDRGEAIFRNGDFRTGLLACSLCHGPSGLGVGDFSPRLAGQSAAYVVEQLQEWRSGKLRDPQGAFMRAEAGHLTEAEIAAVADYVASLGREEADKP